MILRFLCSFIFVLYAIYAVEPDKNKDRIEVKVMSPIEIARINFAAERPRENQLFGTPNSKINNTLKNKKKNNEKGKEKRTTVNRQKVTTEATIAEAIDENHNETKEAQIVLAETLQVGLDSAKLNGDSVAELLPNTTGVAASPEVSEVSEDQRPTIGPIGQEETTAANDHANEQMVAIGEETGTTDANGVQQLERIGENVPVTGNGGKSDVKSEQVTNKDEREEINAESKTNLLEETENATEETENEESSIGAQTPPSTTLSPLDEMKNQIEVALGIQDAYKPRGDDLEDKSGENVESVLQFRGEKDGYEELSQEAEYVQLSEKSKRAKSKRRPNKRRRPESDDEKDSGESGSDEETSKPKKKKVQVATFPPITNDEIELLNVRQLRFKSMEDKISMRDRRSTDKMIKALEISKKVDTSEKNVANSAISSRLNSTASISVPTSTNVKNPLNGTTKNFNSNSTGSSSITVPNKTDSKSGLSAILLSKTNSSSISAAFSADFAIGSVPSDATKLNSNSGGASGGAIGAESETAPPDLPPAERDALLNDEDVLARMMALHLRSATECDGHRGGNAPPRIDFNEALKVTVPYMKAR